MREPVLAGPLLSFLPARPFPAFVDKTSYLFLHLPLNIHSIVLKGVLQHERIFPAHHEASLVRDDVFLLQVLSIVHFRNESVRR
jgi:hypothetical protein